MDELFTFVSNNLCTIAHVVTTVASANNGIGTLLLLENEEEDIELISWIMEQLNDQHLIHMLSLLFGNQYPPPKQSVYLFPDFVCSNFAGRDLLAELQLRPWLLYHMTGETIQSFMSIVEDLRPVIEAVNMEGRPRQRTCRTLLSVENRILVVFIWLWRYQTSSELSTLFLVSPTVIERNITLLTPLLRQYFSNYVRWPSLEEWEGMLGQWENFRDCVGVIDGTLHKIYRPITDPQERFYSGHAKYHCFSTQVVVDNTGNIVFVQCGFYGHLNDAGQWHHIVPPIGQGMPLCLPANSYLFADKGYPNEEPLLTPWRRQRLVGHPDRKFFNTEMSRHRESIEHAIKRLKEYKSMSSLWRHPRDNAAQVMELCAALAQRHIMLTRALR